MNKPHWKAFCLALAAAGLVSACGGEIGNDNLDEWMSSVAEDKRGKIDPLPPIKPYTPARYSPGEGLLDPFDMARLEPINTTNTDANKKLQELLAAREARNNIMERYPLESMRMIGYLKINNQPMAAILVDQITKQVKVGDYIGLDFGKVTKVTDQEVELTEEIQDSKDVWTTRPNSLQMQVGEGG